MTKWDIYTRKAMIEQINNKEETLSVFNARKALYVPIDNSILGRLIKFLIKMLLKRQLRGLDGEISWRCW